MEIVISERPVEGAGAILVGGNHIAFFGSYDDDEVFLFDFQSQKGQLIKLRADGKRIERPVFATQRETAALLWRDAVYDVTLAKLISASKD